jgi:hypothetical protein
MNISQVQVEHQFEKRNQISLETDYNGTHQNCMQLNFLQGRNSFQVIEEVDRSKIRLQVQYVHWISIVKMQREHPQLQLSRYKVPPGLQLIDTIKSHGQQVNKRKNDKWAHQSFYIKKRGICED